MDKLLSSTNSSFTTQYVFLDEEATTALDAHAHIDIIGINVTSDVVPQDMTQQQAELLLLIQVVQLYSEHSMLSLALQAIVCVAPEQSEFLVTRRIAGYILPYIGKDCKITATTAERCTNHTCRPRNTMMFIS